jgi:hypothetical protein
MSREFITARGHPMIRATHPTTLMITKEDSVGQRGNCIIAVGADKGSLDLSDEIKEEIRKGSKILLTLKTDEFEENVFAWGHPALTFTHKTDIVIRKSSFICPRTLGIRSNKGAADISREMVRHLQNTKSMVEISIEALPELNPIFKRQKNPNS